jgi:hypothetical protein
LIRLPELTQLLEMTPLPEMVQLPPLTQLPGMTQLPEITHLPETIQLPESIRLPGSTKWPGQTDLRELTDLPTLTICTRQTRSRFLPPVRSAHKFGVPMLPVCRSCDTRRSAAGSFCNSVQTEFGCPLVLRDLNASRAFWLDTEAVWSSGVRRPNSGPCACRSLS